MRINSRLSGRKGPSNRGGSSDGYPRESKMLDEANPPNCCGVLRKAQQIPFVSKLYDLFELGSGP
jgi:hypothetical protein